MSFYTDITTAIKYKHYVTGLILSNMDLEIIPEDITMLRKLRCLYLSGNKINTLPNWLSVLDILDTLDLSYNELQTIPQVLSNLKSLETLMLFNNPLSNKWHELIAVFSNRVIMVKNELYYIPSNPTDSKPLYIYI